MAKKNKSQDMAQDIIESLKNGTAPWVKPWAADQNIIPHNPISGTRYKGVNSIYLTMQGKPDPRWVTFNQAQKKGWQVKKGTKGTTVQFWQFEKDKKTKDESGKIVTEKVKLERPLLRHYYVFNASEIDGVPELEKDPKVNNEWERQERAERILTESGAKIDHSAGNKACYYPSRDNIEMPLKEQFDQGDKYYATALHELGHWTGHSSRLDRPLSNVFGSEDYAKEELRAEIASWMVGMQLGVGHDPGQHLAYVDSWITNLEDHPTEIFKACADAEKIQSFVMAFELEQKMEQEETITQEKPHYIITDDSLVGLAQNGEFTLDIYKDDPAQFDDPKTALQAALKAKKENAERLDGTEVYVYRVDTPDDIQRDPSIVTGSKSRMQAMWKKNIGGEFPENILDDEVRSLPGMPESQTNKQTGKRFISYFSGKEIDSAGNINLELQQAMQRGTTIGVLRFENALEKNISEESTINIRELSNDGFDGVILTKNGKHLTAITTDEHRLHKGMFQAAKGQEKIFLTVPFAEKDQAKKHGALWNARAKSWFIPEGLDPKPFEKWKTGHSTTADNPQDQFANFIREMGGNLNGKLPHMDGKLHRIPEIGGKPGNKNISYVGHLDGVPAGYVKNFRGGEKNWKMSGVALTDSDRVRLSKEGQEKKAIREKERLEVYMKKAEESQAITDKLSPATGEEDYFKNKGIQVSDPSVKTDTKGNIVIPLRDVSGKQWSHQKLQTNGFKQIFKDSRLMGNFAIIGAKSLGDIKGDYTLVEGYSTGATINEVTGQPVIVCTSSNNLKHVATALHKHNPTKDIYILADDDRYLADQGKPNSGQLKAKEAAQAVGGAVISPHFEKLKKFDKEHTDFHDMARVHGKELLKKHLLAQKSLAQTAKKKQLEELKAKEITRKNVSIER